MKRYVFDGKFSFYLSPTQRERLGVVLPKGQAQYRLRTFSESEDLIHWSPPRFLMYPDRLDGSDCQIYAHVGFVSESMWIGLIQAMRYQATGWKQTDLQLSYSRDGRHWLRPRERRPFLPLGDGESGESDYHVSSYTAPVPVGDELYIYYTSTRNPERVTQDPHAPWPPQQVGLARLRRDGFASLDAGEKPGRILTRPLTFAGKTLFVNAEVADGGWIKAAVVTRDGKPLPGYSLDEAVALTKGATKGRARWKAKDALGGSGDDPLRIEFRLKSAKLYSFWIE